MSVLSWGKPKLEIKKEGTDSWVEITVPIRQGTATLETQEGETTEALDEGGDLVDSRTAKSRYTFTFSLYAGKNMTKPIEDVDGQVTDNYAIRLTPEDSTVPGWIMNKASVSVQDTWSSADGGLWVYTFRALKPSDSAHDMLEPYTAPVANSGSGGSGTGN